MAKNWTDCHLHEHISRVIERLGFASMTPVQSATIPVFLRNKDVAVEAVTGSGKTLAFVIPIMQMLLKKPEIPKKHDVSAVIISPTRELATQISEVVQEFLDEEEAIYTQILFIGGSGEISRDVQTFKEKGGHIIIGTPGRINDAFEHSSILRSAVRSLDILILDEADRLLDLGFHQTVTSILSHLPKLRRTGLFSATQTEETEKLMKAGLRNPVKITVKQKITNSASVESCLRTPTTLKNFYLVCCSEEKFNILMRFLIAHRKEKNLVFFSTCASVDYYGRAVKEFLKGQFEVSLIHGKMRKKRLQIFSDFREKKSGVLLCTDVMARGVDIPEVNWVIQYDPPSSASSFVHRCGRTARIGRQGNALIFLLENEQAYVEFMEINQKAPINEYNFEELEKGATNYLKKIAEMSLNDRVMLERGTKAFVSYIQSYAKHECSLIFRLKDLDFGELAKGFALLRLPRMPELKNRNIAKFEPANVEIATIPYKDKSKEKHRQAELKKIRNGELERKRGRKTIANVSWSKNKIRKDKKVRRKEGKRKRKEREAFVFDDEELDELENDARLVKKLKKGKITDEEFDEKMKIVGTK